MRIAQVAPLYHPVPPERYGGTERVVSYLTEELVRQGHPVTLFAAEGSVTRAELVTAGAKPLGLNPDPALQLREHLRLLGEVFRRSAQFDVAHFHTGWVHFPLLRRHPVPNVTTLHARLDMPGVDKIYREFRESPVVSISNAQRQPHPQLNWQGTVYHGLPPDLYALHERPGDYLAFLGSISPEKRCDIAIEIAARSGFPLKIAAAVYPADRPYFHSVIEPLLQSPGVEFIGEIADREKNDLLGGAAALLFPGDKPEPFGMVMIEAMACGTPVIAFRRGGIPEVMSDARAGFVVDTVEQAIDAAGRLGSVDRTASRRFFEQRFTAERMAQSYVRVYERLLNPASAS